jgi:hypothetical protein
VKEGLELAGFFAAHAVWCLAPGDVLAPLAGYESDSGERRMLRFEDDGRGCGEEQIREWFEEHRDGASRAVLVYDGYVDAATGRWDAIVIEVRVHEGTTTALRLAVPYRGAGSEEGFALYRPRFLSFTGAGGVVDTQALDRWFFAGVDQHEKGAAVWDAYLAHGRG